MEKVKKYSREAEYRLPTFRNHRQARLYFKNKHGDSFVLVGSEVVHGEKMYFYNLILDINAYNQGVKELTETGYAAGLEFMNSYQPIEISENGSIHMIH